MKVSNQSLQLVIRTCSLILAIASVAYRRAAATFITAITQHFLVVVQLSMDT